MKKQKQVKKSLKRQKSATIDWFSHVLNDEPKLAIPVGPRFQADVPEWTGPPQKMYPHRTLTKSSSSKWLGTVIWSSKQTQEPNRDIIGKGRPDHCCDCNVPGSVLCVKRHVTEKHTQLQKDLGPAFQKWKFNEMGESVAVLWKQFEQHKFAEIVRTNPVSKDKNFIKPALESLPSKSQSAIVSYYFNVYLPRRIGLQTRSGCTQVDTDDEEDDKSTKNTPCSKGSLKRAQTDGGGHGCKVRKVTYLSGRR